MAIVPKLSILTFPQKIEGNTLHLNVLIIPRNIDPFQSWPETGAPAWVDANLQLKAFILSGLEKFPFASPASTPKTLNGIGIPGATRKIFTLLQSKFNIVPAGPTKILQPPKAADFAKKYLPLSYRSSFNFTNPRTEDAVLDDSYHCAIKANNKKNPAFVPSDDNVCWGEVFAYCLRQPALAKKAGFIYETSIPDIDLLYKDGGWLYVDIAPGSSYSTVADKPFIKKYAARIPALKPNDKRNLFAAIQFPVKENEADPDPSGFDEIFPEASAYDDGFAKIVHVNQPVSADLLAEEINDHPPIHDIGIRLAWDDEQLLIWLNRQLRPDPADVSKTKRFDSPMGVFQYHIDVKEKAAINWNSLTLVENKVDIALDINDAETIIGTAGEKKELGIEVYPAKLDGYDTSHYWLPAYFTQWIGKSLVVPDKDAAELYKTDQAGVKLNNLYTPIAEENIELIYGKDYEFRVRLSDPTGGGPGFIEHSWNKPLYGSPSPVALCKFRRHVVPQPVLIKTVLPKKDDFFEGTMLSVQRPRLGYPSVVFTGKYGLNVINLLKADRDEAIKFVQDPVTHEVTTMNREFGLHDPDVTQLEICVEIKALEMDTLLSKSKTESYIHLYTTNRKFPHDGSFTDVLEVPVEYVDAPVLQFSTSPILQDLGLSNDAAPVNIHDLENIVLPKARNIRITIKAVCHDTINYFGNDLFRYGKPTSFFVRKSSVDETNLIKNNVDTEEIKGIYLQPDTELLINNKALENFLLGDIREKQPDLIQRLADAIGVENKGFSLVAKPGRRIQFGCNRHIRNSISPDGTSITFSTKADLLNHWIVPIKLLLNRDWSWDGLEITGFVIHRRQWFKKELKPVNAEIVGDIEMKQIINIQALKKPDRSQTWLIFFDAVEPKPLPGKHPDLIELEYTIEPRFKAGHGADHDPELIFELELPVTTPPAQVPKIVSAGLALSKYNRDKTYSTTEPREKYLWLEFEDPLQDPNDSYFVRVIGYAPDPLLSDWRFELFSVPPEPPLPINPELIRMISPLQPEDNSGLDAMQEMTAISSSKRHYIVPLPPGLHPDSNEMFGFFTYELRVGHRHIWSTAQGRFGRALKTAGVQHAAPALFCTVDRNEKRILIDAPFAMVVSNGKNVTSRPPRTQIWSLLYAQVLQADGNDFRNILLQDKLMILQPKSKKIMQTINEDVQAHAVGGWTNKEVIDLLRRFGLPEDSSLSVVCVEMLPVVFSLLQRETDSFKSGKTRNVKAGTTMNQALMNHIEARFSIREFSEKEADEQVLYNNAAANYIKPLSDQLGNYRILRTSPFTAVPAVCCTDC